VSEGEQLECEEGLEGADEDDIVKIWIACSVLEMVGAFGKCFDRRNDDRICRCLRQLRVSRPD
jgi:hypothetical protein